MKEHFCKAERSVIAYMGECNWCGQKEWVGLTDDEILKAWHWGGCNPHIEGAHFKVLYQYFEAKLKKKNHVAQETD